MTDKGFENYLFAAYGHKSGTAKSYITAIHIIDEMFTNNDVFSLKGKSITFIEDIDLLDRIAEFVQIQQSLFKRDENSIFNHINSKQRSYPGKGFCSAAIRQLLKYRCKLKEKEAWEVTKNEKDGEKISKNLLKLFKVDKEGSDVMVSAKVRLGQGYFRKMVLQNFGNKCCVTGLNVPQTLRASHIVAWADDVKNRMNPENGLCLSATYDAAFDKHLISFDENYRMILSKEIKEYFTAEITKEYFNNYEGKQFLLPSQFLPSKKLLEKHRNLMIG